MSEPTNDRYQFVLDQASNNRLDEIARHFSAELMTTVNRSQAVRLLIARFRLPKRSAQRPTDADPTKAAA